MTNNGAKVLQGSGLKTAHLILSICIIIMALLAQTGGFFYWGGKQATELAANKQIDVRQDGDIKNLALKLEGVATKEDVKELKLLISKEQADTAKQIDKTRDLIDLKTLSGWTRSEQNQFQSINDQRIEKNEKNIITIGNELADLKIKYNALPKEFPPSWFEQLVRQNIRNIEELQRSIRENERKK